MKHTPGPWLVVLSRKNGAALRIEAPDSRSIAGGVGSVIRQNGIGMPACAVGRANARLIAAAPDLLVELRNMIEVYWGEGDGHGSPPTCIINARAAIAKATGQP